MRSQARSCLVVSLCVLIGCALQISAFMPWPHMPRRPGFVAVTKCSTRLGMGREWITDSFPEIPEHELQLYHDFIDNKGKNVVRGPATVTAPDGRIVDVRVGEEVEIIGGMVFRTYLQGFPPVDEARLKAEGKVMLEIKWGTDWEKDGITLEVFGVTGPDCVEYTNRFCEATGCKPKGDVVCKPAYYEVALDTKDALTDKLKALQAGVPINL